MAQDLQLWLAYLGARAGPLDTVSSCFQTAL